MTSERFAAGHPRRYKVRRFDEDCRVHTQEQFLDLAVATETAQALALEH